MTVQSAEDKVVISGISGRFPEADNMHELCEKLFAGTDLLTVDQRKLTKGFYEDIPDKNGQLKSSPSMFDYTFFGISKAAATALDSMICLFLQRTFEAVIDAGINPIELRGTNTSVFTGTCHSDSDLQWLSYIRTGYGIMGRNRCMHSNRISYWLDLNGASHSSDSGWSNGISNLCQGWHAVKSGQSDAAIVGVCNLQQLALATIQINDFGVLSPDGITRSFDDSANGWGRASAVVVLVLQRESMARRCYATIEHAFWSTMGSPDNVISKPSQKDWEAMLNEFYQKSKINVNDIYYVEAHGSAIKEDDAAEINALTEVFCQNRKNPLLIGCIKSNMGHSESSSFFCGLVKAVISLEKGMIPQNLHYKNPNSLCPGLTRGIIKVVDSNTPLPQGACVAVNCHSFGGIYGHVVLRPQMKKKVIQYDGIPRLVLLADRTNDTISKLFENVESVSYDAEFIALLQEIHSKKVERYFGRGYTILPNTDNTIHENQVYNDEKRPIWFIFSGMGSQWPGMGKRLMALPIFRESIEKSHKILEDKGLNLIQILTNDDPHMFDNILNSFVGIAAVQIALIDLLRALNVVPDGLIGHSVGELGCSYADGCFTAEQMILAAYYRGRASRESELIRGSMAAVGKGYKNMKDQLPEDIEIACHNSSESCTLSGPVASIEKFVEELKANGVFAKAVNVSNIAYHSRYIKPAAPKLLQYLKEIVPNPKLRSPKWISTSNSEDKWDTDIAKYCSAEYHTNNLLSSVLFEEGSKHIPKNAICIEIAPHGLLQAILKRSLGDEVTNIPLTNRSSSDPLIFLLQAIGKMYMAGIDISMKNIYPKINYPVSRGTPFLSHLPNWFEQKFTVTQTSLDVKTIYSFKERLINVASDGIGVIINGKNTYPIGIFLGFLWELFAANRKLKADDCPVIFQNFKIDNLVDIHLSEDDNKLVYYLNGTGDFEIDDGDIFLSKARLVAMKEKPISPCIQYIQKPDLFREEIYSELKRKGYDFGESFKSLQAISFKEDKLLAEISSSCSWYQIIESMLQLHLLHAENSMEFLLYPYFFEQLEISSLMHIQYRNSLQEKSRLMLVYDFITNTVTCGGLSLKGVKCCQIPRLKRELEFSSANFFSVSNPPLQNILRFADFCLGIVVDNLEFSEKFCGINIIEVTEKSSTLSIGGYLEKIHFDWQVKLRNISNMETNITKQQAAPFVILPPRSIDEWKDLLGEGAFVLVKMSSVVNLPSDLILIAKFTDDQENEYLFLKKYKLIKRRRDFIKIDEESDDSLTLKLKELKPTEKIKYVISFKKPSEGIEAFKARLQALTIVPLRWVFILDPQAPAFDAEEPLYKLQLQKDLCTNIYNDGTWCFFYKYSFLGSSVDNEINFNIEKTKTITPSYLSIDPNENPIKLEQIEFSGKSDNKKVMGINKLLNHRKICLDRYMTWEIPESFNLEEAVTVPLSYALAYYCLVILGKLKKTEKVLVSDAFTCIGQAHVAVALSIGCRVYITVSNKEEAIQIKKIFPQIKESDILNHNEHKFCVKWKLKAKEDYINIVVNLMDGELFYSILTLIGEFGRIFHYGKEELKANSSLGTYMFLETLSFFAVSPDVLLRLPEEDKKLLHELMEKGLKSGIIKPLPRITTCIKQLQKFQRTRSYVQDRLKSVLKIENEESSYVKFNTESSYLILGDETDLWVDIVEWLLNRKVTNIIVGRKDSTKVNNLRLPVVENRENLLIYDHQCVDKLLTEVEKLGHLSVVFYISLSSSEENICLKYLNQLYRSRDSHFIAISKSQGYLSDLCTLRNNLGLPSTNFIWCAERNELKDNLEYMTRLSSKESVIHVTPPVTLSTIDHRLSDLLPSSLEDFIELGSSLSPNTQIISLNTLAGLARDSFREITPIIIIPGLNTDPVKMLQPLVSNFLYPAVCLKIPDVDLSVAQMGSFILPEIIKFNKGNYYNIVGISSGSHIAMEVTKQLEKIGATVGLILVEGPIQNAKSLVTKSLEWDLLNIIQGKFKISTDIKVQSNTELNWQLLLNATLNSLRLTPEKEKNVVKAVHYIHSNLKALLEHDIASIEFQGPFTLVVSGQRQFDDKVLSKICKSISIRCLPISSEELMLSEKLWQIVHGSAISQPMSNNTVHQCTWPALEMFISKNVEENIYEETPNCAFFNKSPTVKV